MYQVLIERRAEKDLKALPSNNPRPHGSQKLHDLGSDYRIRIGDYRLLYEIDDKAKTVKIFRVKHRGHVYR